MPDSAAYLARIQEISKGKDPVAMQRETPGAIAGLIRGKSDEQLRRRPRPGKWSAGEIIAHLAEDEMATGWRYRQMVEHGGLDLGAFDQDLWADLGDYAARSPQESLELFRLLRQANVQFLARLTPQQWECGGVHAERGPITIRGLVGHMAGHDANHLEQIRNILR